MHTKYFNLIVATAFAMFSLGCQDETTGPASHDGPNFAAVASTQIVVTQLSTTKFVPCANGGLGEDVFLSGPFHSVFHVTLDGSGGAHVDVVHNPQGVSGTGLITGTKYVGVGASPQDEFTAKVGEEHTSVTNKLIVGQGSGNNLVMHITMHTTILGDGTVTSFVDNVSVECK